ncbi:hypothetical protein Sjap_015458 [Stephania japonica]|uniref:Uncharacterized protein n=1 Tax=Stephania japonica TaxID=461633 RepID=A0AAP0IJ58_9MAGN
MRAHTKSIENHHATDFQVRSDLLNFFVSALDLDILYLRGAAINGDERARFEALGVRSDLSNFFAFALNLTLTNTWLIEHTRLFDARAYINEVLQIRKDVETKGNLIRSLFEKIRAAADERDVLKYFNWSERKADAMREAAIEYRDLKRLASEDETRNVPEVVDQLLVDYVERFHVIKTPQKLLWKKNLGAVKVRNFIGLDTQGAISNTIGAPQVFEFVRKDDRNCVGIRAPNGNFLQITCNLYGVSCTGEGEVIIRGTLARDVAAVMEYKGLKLQEAVDWVVKNRLDGQAGMIVVSSEGEMAYGFNSNAMFRGCATEYGFMEMGIWE